MWPTKHNLDNPGQEDICLVALSLLLQCCFSPFLDNDECSRNNGGCQHICKNQPGSFSCICRAGYALLSDGRSCKGERLKFIKIVVIPTRRVGVRSSSEDPVVEQKIKTNKKQSEEGRNDKTRIWDLTASCLWLDWPASCPELDCFVS